MRKTHRILCLALVGLLVLSCQVSNADTDIKLEQTSNNWGYRLTISNDSNGQPIREMTVSLTDGQFDFSTNPTPTQVVPSLGGNNDGLSSAMVTWTPASPIQKGEAWIATGDIDGSGLSGADVELVYADGTSDTLSLARVGQNFEGSVAGAPAVPAAIIDGRAVVTFDWIAPVEYENDQPIPPGALDGFMLFWDTVSGMSRCGGRPASLQDRCYGNAVDIDNGAATQFVLDLAVSGDTTMFFVLVAYVLGENDEQLISAYTGELAREFAIDITETPDPLPDVPSIIDVEIDVTCTTDDPRVTCNIIIN